MQATLDGHGVALIFANQIYTHMNKQDRILSSVRFLFLYSKSSFGTKFREFSVKILISIIELALKKGRKNE